MKILVRFLCFSALTTCACAQGTVNFANTPSTLISWENFYTGYSTPIPGSAGSFYFALLISPPGSNAFRFTGILATNSATAPGRFVRNGVTVPGWAPGVTMDYRIVGWEGVLGTTFNNDWLVQGFADGGAFSAIGTGAAGGNMLPPLPLFGGTGITGGFTILYNCPEPPPTALAALGAAVLFALRLRKRTGR